MFLSVKFYRALKQAFKSVNIFFFLVLLILIKIQTFVYCFSGGFYDYFPCEFKESSWIRGYFKKQTCFVFYFLEADMIYFLMLPHPTSRATTYIVGGRVPPPPPLGPPPIYTYSFQFLYYLYLFYSFLIYSPYMFTSVLLKKYIQKE